VKESGFVSLGWRAEANRTILVIARGKVLPEALKLGHIELDNPKYFIPITAYDKFRIKGDDM